MVEPGSAVAILVVGVIIGLILSQILETLGNTTLGDIALKVRIAVASGHSKYNRKAMQDWHGCTGGGDEYEDDCECLAHNDECNCCCHFKSHTHGWEEE